MLPVDGFKGSEGMKTGGNAGDTGADERLRWARIRKAQGWGYYRAAFTHGRRLFDEALAAFEEAEAFFRGLETKEGRDELVGTLSGKATVLRASGLTDNIRRSITLYEEETVLLRELGREEDLPEALINLALAYRDLVTVEPAAAREMSRGVESCREALESAKRHGKPEAQALSACTLGDFCVLMAGLDREDLREEHLKEALGFYGQAEKLWEGRDKDGQALARLGLAEAYILLKKNLDGARDLLDEVLEYYQNYSQTPVSGPVRYQVAQVRELQARLFEAEGMTEQATQSRRQAREELDSLGFRLQ